jgi:stalled ribosome rescue protein Dom34
LAYETSDEQLPLAERMIELALNTSAAVTPVEGAAAERLGEHGGVAALLRY